MSVMFIADVFITRRHEVVVVAENSAAAVARLAEFTTEQLAEQSRALEVCYLFRKSPRLVVEQAD